jgi:hypothetical protein
MASCTRLAQSMQVALLQVLHTAHRAVALRAKHTTQSGILRRL